VRVPVDSVAALPCMLFLPAHGQEATADDNCSAKPKASSPLPVAPPDNSLVPVPPRRAQTLFPGLGPTPLGFVGPSAGSLRKVVNQLSSASAFERGFVTVCG
jgi:hypothetical protein